MRNLRPIAQRVVPKGRTALRASMLTIRTEGTIQGRPFYSNGHILIVGEPPAWWKRRGEPERALDEVADYVLPKSLTTTAPTGFDIVPIRFGVGEDPQQTEVIWFHGGGTVQARYFDILRHAGAASWKVGKVKKRRDTFVGYGEDGAIVGVVMAVDLRDA